MVKTREFTEFERCIIIELKKSKKFIREIENLTRYFRNAIFNIINNYEKKGITKPLPRSGRPLKLSQKNKKQLIQFIKKNKNMTLDKITENFNDLLKISVTKKQYKKLFIKKNFIVE